MKKAFYKTTIHFLHFILVCLSLNFSAKATIYPFNLTFSGAQEVPPNATPGTGTIIGTYNDATNTIAYTITFSGLLSPTVAAHFHAPAPAGVNAPVIIAYAGFPLGVTSGVYSNSHIITDAQETQLLSGLWYSNIHSIMFPGGEIRTQMILGTPSSLIYSFNHTFSGSQEVPPNPSTGTGTIVGTYNEATNTIDYAITFTGLVSPTAAAHFHAPALPGVNAPVLIGYAGFPVGVTSGVYSNSHIITDVQESQLLSGLWYSNIHSNASPGGEIRTQIILQILNPIPQAINPYTTCPDVNIAVARAGTNSDVTNPYFLYNVNQATGAMTLVPGGPFKDPSNPTQNLQVNAIGVSKKDGFIYGLVFDGTVTTARFVRLDQSYGVTSFGNVASPVSPTGPVGIVNSAAGETDTAGNYYFTAVTLTAAFALDKFFIGKIANTNTMVSGPPAVTYYEVDLSNANCSNYVSTFTSDPNNSGLKDFSYNAFTNTFFSYATYKLPLATNFSGQVIEFRPVAGSSPLRYELVCNPLVNTHSAETSGTLIDKFGKFTVLFTDGSFGEANRNASGVYDGTYTQITASTGLPNPLRGDMASCGQQTLPPPPRNPYTTCPDVNIAVARAGTNSDVTNPYFLYNVNQATGAMTLVPGGPFKDPDNPSQNLQVNAIGVSKKDGFIYGLVFDGTVTTARFVRLDQSYGVTSFGNVASPVSPTGPVGIVNSAAGETDTAGNYYFTAATLTIIPTPGLDKFFIGKIANTNTLVSGPPAVTYYEVDLSNANCSNFVSTFTSDPNNSGLKDFSYNAATNTFFSYATYKLPAAANFSGQVIEFRPIAGSSPLRYELVCNPVVNTHAAETAGTLIDKFGNFTVLFTDGSFGMANKNAAGVYDGTFTQITAATGLPNPLRGDMASCGQKSVPPAFTTCPDVNIAVARAGTNSDVTNPYFLYNVNQATGAMTLIPGGPFKDPANPTQNLQVNAIGVSKKDGFIYGLVFDGTVTTARFVRLDQTYGVTSFGNVASPVSPTGPVGIVNSAAGEMDTAGNYYFTAATLTAALALDKFFIGKIANTNTMVSGPPAVTYYEVDLSNANCSNYVSTFTSDPNNSGLKDFSYNAFTNTFFSYATYKLPAAANFSGQVIEFRPVAGSSPLRYELVCNPVVNTHTAETAGTLIDKFGKFTVLFTDGSFGEANRNPAGVYDGTYTQITASTGLPNPLRGDMASCGQQTVPPPPTVPFTCPASIAVARAGFNADITNPYFIYNVNTATGAMTLIPGGPLVYPSNPSQTLQVNAVGLNSKDGFAYGMAFEGSVNTARLVRFDKNYGVTLIGNIVPPVSPTGLFSFVNSAAGEVDRLDNYYFFGITGNPGAPPGTIVLDKLYFGKIANVSTIIGTPTPDYFEIDATEATCSNFISTINSDPNNSGIRDLSFNGSTNTFFTYVTYKPTGSPDFSGQMVEFRPIAGSSPLKYKMFCTNIINTHTAEVAGTLIDAGGNFEVLLTDGTVGRIESSGLPFSYTGLYLPLNNSTGLPPVIRADMASCGSPTNIPLPVELSSFNITQKDCKNAFRWVGENEINFSHYELEESTDNIHFNAVKTVISKQGTSSTTYQVTLPATARQVFYRLKMVDKDGNYSYSRILNVNNKCDVNPFGFIINPNPVTNTLNLNWYGIKTTTKSEIIIYNAYGSVIKKISKTLTAGNVISSINVNELPAGLYFIQAIDSKNNISFQAKFIKQ